MNTGNGTITQCVAEQHNHKLPIGINFEDHNGDLILTGPGLSRETYAEIMATLPEALRDRFMGWKIRTGRIA